MGEVLKIIHKIAILLLHNSDMIKDTQIYYHHTSNVPPVLLKCQ